MKDAKVYLFVCALFFIPLGLGAAAAFFFLPRRIACMAVSLAGFILVVAGPFWVLQLEAYVRRKLKRERYG